jgi:hypothetical protein
MNINLLQAKAMIQNLLKNSEISNTPEGMILTAFLKGEVTIATAISAIKTIQQKLKTPQPTG